jgi:hypothetical protein
MKYLIYISLAVGDMSNGTLSDILKISRKNNKERDITGVLLFSENTFIQVLEGAPGDVDNIFAAIEKSNHHTNVIKLVDKPLEKRNFPDWQMGFSSITGGFDPEMEGYLRSSATLLENDSDHLAINILKTYITNNNLEVSF